MWTQKGGNGSRRKLMFAAILGAAMAFPVAAPAAVLSKDPARNADLANGEYRFWQYHLPWAGSFEDQWSFSLSQPSRISIQVGSFDLRVLEFQLFGIENLGLALDSSGSGHSSRILAAVLDRGTHRFLVAGDVNGILGGKYAGNLEVSAVPLPPALVLFGCALLALAGMGRFRARARTATG